MSLSPERPASQLTEPATANNRPPFCLSEAHVVSFSSHGSVVEKVSLITQIIQIH